MQEYTDLPRARAHARPQGWPWPVKVTKLCEPEYVCQPVSVFTTRPAMFWVGMLPHQPGSQNGNPGPPAEPATETQWTQRMKRHESLLLEALELQGLFVTGAYYSPPWLHWAECWVILSRLWIRALEHRADVRKYLTMANKFKNSLPNVI